MHVFEMGAVRSSGDLRDKLGAISSSLFPFLHAYHPCCGLFSDGFCGALLIPNGATKVSSVIIMEYVETE